MGTGDISRRQETRGGNMQGIGRTSTSLQAGSYLKRERETALLAALREYNELRVKAIFQPSPQAQAELTIKKAQFNELRRQLERN
jgi:hypothetical protein